MKIKPLGVALFNTSVRLIGLLGVALASLLSASSALAFGGFNTPGNILIADQFNNRVIEIAPDGTIVWSFGHGPTDFTPQSIIGCNDAQRVGPLTLMSGTGTPPGVIPQATNGAVDNRVLLVDEFGQIVWQYGKFGQTGSGHDLLNTPVQSTFLPDVTVLITDQGNNRIIDVDLDKKIVWQFPGSNMDTNAQLNSPNSAELLENGHVLIADENNSRVLEVTRDDQIVNILTAGGTLNTVAFASRLPNGDTLITDAGNSRIVEVDANDNVVWEYFTNEQKNSIPLPLPTRAVRLRNGDTLISNQFDNQVIEINSAKKIVAIYGLPLVSSTGDAIDNNVGYNPRTSQKGLYSPYDAKVIGDYTGLTPPFDFDGDADDTGL